MISKNVITTFFILSGTFCSAYADSVASYFNHNQKKSYTDPYYGRSRIGDNLESILLSEIWNARTSISIAVYDLDLPLVAHALVAKKQQGLDIKLVLETDNAKIWNKLSADEIANADEHTLKKYNEFIAFADLNGDGLVSFKEQMKSDSLLILQSGGISWVDDTFDGSKGSGLMHHKFMIVDQKVLITGSANFTRSCIHGDLLHENSKGNANSLLKIESNNVINFFQYEFNEMFLRHRFGVDKLYRGPRIFDVNGSRLTIQFSPTPKEYSWEDSTNGLIAQQFADAKKTSDLALFVFSDQQISDVIKTANENGMVNRTLIDRGFATRYYSELLDILGLEMKSPKCAIELGNNPWNEPSINSGVPNLDDGDVLHHKFAVIDKSKVIVGSHNWSESANKQNDEALLVIDDTNIANQYSAEFENLFKTSTLGTPAWLTKKISDLNKQCAESN